MKKYLIGFLFINFLTLSSAMALMDGLPSKSHRLLTEAYHYVDNNQLDEGLEKVNLVLVKFPNDYNAQTLHAQIYQLQKNWPASVVLLSRVIAQYPDEAFPYVQRGYAYYHLGEDEKALEDFKTALSEDANSENPLSPESIDTVRETRLHIHERAAARGHQKEIGAKKQVAPAVVSVIPAHSVTKSIEPVKKASSTPFSVPETSVLPKTVVKQVVQKADDQAVHLETLKKQMTRGQYQQALNGLDKIKTATLKTSYAQSEYLFLRAGCQWELGRKKEAIQTYDKLEKGKATPYMLSEAFYKKALYASEQGDKVKTLEYIRISVSYLETETRYIQAAYVCLSQGMDREATAYFEKAMAIKDNQSSNVFLDAAYAYKRQGENQAVRSYLKKAIDKDSAIKNPTSNEVARLYYARREHADLVRRFGSNTSLIYLHSSDEDAVQAIQELYWQPYYQNGKVLQVFAQVANNLATRLSSSGISSTYGNIGVRYEPLADYNLVLTVEELIKIGSDTRNDFRTRIGYSWDDGLEYNPVLSNWNYTTFFNEWAHSLSYGKDIYIAEARQGRSFKAGKNWVVSPHIMGYANYDGAVSGDEDKWNLSVGPGVHIRKWYREDTYNAPQSYADIVLQYKASVNGNDNILWLNLYNSF